MENLSAPEELLRRYGLQGHVENGAFVECNYPHTAPGRADSGAIYYYVSPNEYTKFHVIDCDEYWCYIAGSPLEIWQISPEGAITTVRLGIEEGCEPLVYLKKGVTFASRRFRREQEGTFLSCITVPRFTYEGFTLVEDEDAVKRWPDTKAFFEAP